MSDTPTDTHEYLRSTPYSDPFSDSFDHARVTADLGEVSNADIESVLKFLAEANGISTRVTEKIHAVYCYWTLSNTQTIELLFTCLNEMQYTMLKRAHEPRTGGGTVLDFSRSDFMTLQDSDGSSHDAQSILEGLVDIQTVLLQMLNNFEVSTEVVVRNIEAIPKEEISRTFHEVFISAAYYRSTYDSYQRLIYNNGIVTFDENETSIIVESEMLICDLLSKVAGVRERSKATEIRMPLTIANTTQTTKVRELELAAVKGRELHLRVLENEKLVAEIFDSLVPKILYNQYLLDQTIHYFGNCTVDEICKLFELICNAVSMYINPLLRNANISSDQIPIKIKRKHLEEALLACTKIKSKTIKRCVKALIADHEKPDFWRSPFLEVGEHLYFPIIPLLSPNINLYIDSWLKNGNVSLERQLQLFARSETAEFSSENTSGFSFAPSRRFHNLINKKNWISSIAFETRDKVLLVETVICQFPIHSKEHFDFRQNLQSAAISLDKKKQHILHQLADEDKEVIGFILPTYGTLAGLTIDGYHVVDSVLFTNYFISGSFGRAKVSFDQGAPQRIDETGMLTYYRTEDEFNTSIEPFFRSPVPIEFVARNQVFERTLLTAPNISPKIHAWICKEKQEEEIFSDQVKSLDSIFSFKYFVENEESAVDTEEEALFAYGELINRLAFSRYSEQRTRIDLANSLRKYREQGIGFSWLYILNQVEQLTNVTIENQTSFDFHEVKEDHVYELFGRVLANGDGKMQVSKANFDGVYNVDEQKEIASFCSYALSLLVQDKYSDEQLNNFHIPLYFLYGVSKSQDLTETFYTLAENLVSACNYNNKYQAARDLCEELLLTASNDNCHEYGWGIVFECYIYQRNPYEAGLYGSLFYGAIAGHPTLTYKLAIDAHFKALKYFRNFGARDYCKSVFEFATSLEFDEYDKQKLALSYFNSFLDNTSSHSSANFMQTINYYLHIKEKIWSFGDQGKRPWLAQFHNIKRIRDGGHVTLEYKLDELIDELESELGAESASSIRKKVVAETPDKADFITIIENIFSTRSFDDLIHEIQQHRLTANKFLISAFDNSDYDAIFLSGLVKNDQSISFKNIDTEIGTVRELNYTASGLPFQNLTAYKDEILNSFKLKENQLIVWLLEVEGFVYKVSIGHDDNISHFKLESWDSMLCKRWVKELSSFFFNAKKTEYYAFAEQQEDYDKELDALKFAELDLPDHVEELLLISSIELSMFPPHLLINKGNFIGAQIPVVTIPSFEALARFTEIRTVKEGYTVSAWIPTEDGDMTLNWGNNLLGPILAAKQATVFNGQYPESIIESDINLFMAHGEKGNFGFRGIYSNDETPILHPHKLFGRGAIAILFICSSGSTQEELFANRTASFCLEVLKQGYESVIAPFWKFNVEIAPRWLKEFIDAFDDGVCVSQAVYFANLEISKYEAKTSSQYYAPAGRFAMHLVGNPNVVIDK
jgi:hypothetical protein